MMTKKFKISFLEFLPIAIAFTLFTIIGTISHEYGHIVVAKYLGYETELHYGSMNYNRSQEEIQFGEIYEKYKFSIQNNEEFPEKARYQKLAKKLYYDNLFIAIGGPFQTILTGTIGLILLLFRRKKILQNGMKFIDWLYVFLSLFWLREVCNLTMSVYSSIVKGQKSYFGGDEKNIALMLDIPQGSVAIPLAIIGLCIALFVIFRVIPKEQRMSFIIGGVLGGVTGFILWLQILGPIILP